MAQKNVIVYDLEIQKDPSIVGWENTFELGLSSCVAYSYETKQYHFFGHTEEERIRCIEFLNGATCVTFNGIRFDSRVLLGNDRVIHPNCETTATVNGKLYKWTNYDIYMKILQVLSGEKDCSKVLDNKTFHGKGLYSLDTLCRRTLGISKNGDGALAPKLFQDGNFYELLQYNLQDVRMTKDLFEFVQKYNYVINGNHDVVKLT